jgi:hypothetical protein
MGIPWEQKLIPWIVHLELIGYTPCWNIGLAYKQYLKARIGAATTIVSDGFFFKKRNSKVT